MKSTSTRLHRTIVTADANYLQKRFLLPDPIPSLGTAQHTDHDADRAPNGHAMSSVYSFAPCGIEKKGSALGFVAPPARTAVA
jgi:hypothetical protein